MADLIASIRRRPWVWVLTGWTLLGAYYGARNIVSAVTRGRQVDWARDFLYEVVYWCAWAALMPLIVWFARRMRSRLSPGKALLAVAAFGLIVTLLQGTLEATIAIGVDRFVIGDAVEVIAARLPQIVTAVALGCFTGYITYWIIVGADFALGYYDAYRQREVAAASLERRLTEATLQNLRAQLQPHFLFNALNTASVLMMRDAPAARQVLVRLSDLLRTTLRTDGDHEVPLREELEYARQYLAIEQVRFSDRLQVQIDVDPQLGHALVPAMVLQPLVENAIRHGIGARSAAGTIAVRARRSGDRLEIEVQDDGPGFDAAARDGVGLSNTRARLSQLYGGQHSIETSNIAAGGALVTIVLPFRRAG